MADHAPPLPRADDVHLIACDVDGTLLTTEHVVHPKTVAAIKHIRETRPDLPIVISSGKQFNSCEHLRKQLDLGRFPASHAHGSVIYGSSDEILWNVSISSKLVLQLVQELQEANRATFIFTDTRCLLVNEEKGGKDWLSIAGKYDKAVEDYVSRREEVLRGVEKGEIDIIKVTVCAEPGNVDELILSLAKSYPGLGLTRAIPFILELHDPDTNKGTALKYICNKLGISTKNCLVFGDGENDVAMFREAGYSVSMGNGMEAAKVAATYQTSRNDDGGVGEFLDRVFR